MYINCKTVLTEIQSEIDPSAFEGQVASYIPELAKVPPSKFGMHLIQTNGHEFGFGDHLEKFSIQSISKVFALILAYRFRGEEIFNRVGIEPSGNPFNSLVQLEYENGIPRNPLINAGALVTSDMLISDLKDPRNDFLDFVRNLNRHDDIYYDHDVAHSERNHGYRNSALVNMMKSFGNIENDVEEVLDFYFHMCSLSMSCKELASAFLLLANHGVLSNSDEKILNTSSSKRIMSIMQNCGFYDEAGEFSYRVGLPGKSGVGGGIVAIHPGLYSAAVWNPKLNAKGNSSVGMKALELLTTKTGNSIF